MIDPLDLERLAVRIERLAQTQTHGWGGDELEFRRGLGSNARGRGDAQTMEYRPYELPNAQWLREVAQKIRSGVPDGEGYTLSAVQEAYRNAIQLCLRMEGLVQSNDPRNPRSMMRDMARGKFPGRYAGMAARVAARHISVEYQGKLPVVVLKGQARIGVSEEELLKSGGRVVLRGEHGVLLHATSPVMTPDKAEAAVYKLAHSYEMASPRGGKAEVVGLVNWIDHGTWSGILNWVDSDVASRVASAHTAASISLRGEAFFTGKGTGRDEGWTLYFSEVKPSGNGYDLEGYLRWHMNQRDDQWMYFTASVGQTPGKLSKVQVRKRSDGLQVDTFEGLDIAERLFANPAQQTKFWGLLDGMFPASVRGEYQGKLTVLPLEGRVRDMVSGEDLRRFGGHAPYSGGRYGPTISATPPVATPAAAEAAATASAKKYEQDQWPGGMAAVVGLVKWVDHGTWSGLVNTYFSPS